MKWKNYGLWVSLASILYMVLKDLGMQIDLTTWETYVTAIIGFLAALGIISNPDKGRGFFDKIPDTPTEALTQVAEQLQNQNEPPTSQQSMPQQNQYPSHVQQSQGSLQPQMSVNQPQQYQNVQQNDSNPANIEQNEYQRYQAQQYEQQDYSNQNGGTYSQEFEPTQVQPEVNEQVNQHVEPSFQGQSPENNSFDRTNIHGMPAPPNEHM
ncbi:hypothetical protein RGU12_06805 [Fredinandcohnia sp. QZ13]|uniref:hypothetical protein n=1 Tax=Fredinandcohnia sp. QZ13 TaxID=3073144 RepID=UPI002853450B|nr:hypothetical protein [Fredinandcohnia sp. QZ13]MDR4887267.1 hypothetical protein [Fredinandcohnia sp. QZ13]